MVEPGPLTAGQVSVFLSCIVIFISWAYSELLAYKRSFSRSKVHFGTNLVELGNQVRKEDEHTVLLEGGIAKSTSPKFQNASVRANLVRFLRRDEGFFLENHELLRTMAEFGAILIYFHVCDRTDLFAQSNKITMASATGSEPSGSANAIANAASKCV